MQPPPNPYDGFPNPNEPVPPSPYSPGVPPQRPQISFDVISQAWTVLQSSLGTYVGATFVALIPMALSYIVYFSAIMRAPKDSLGQPDLTQIGGAVFLVLFLGSLAYSYLLVGVLRMAINHLKTGHADFGQIFSIYDVFLRLILAYILIVLAMYIGFCLCIIPGLLLMGLYMLVAPLIVDRRMGPIEAMRASFNALKSQMWMAILFLIVLSLIAQVGVIACGVGALFTIPLTIIAIAITYRNFFPDGSGGFNFPTQTGPTPPIADPMS